jgi:sulfate adenylyltransferase
VVPLSERSKLVAEAAKLPSIALTRADLSTVHRLADGTLSPLEGRWAATPGIACSTTA